MQWHHDCHECWYCSPADIWSWGQSCTWTQTCACTFSLHVGSARSSPPTILGCHIYFKNLSIIFLNLNCQIAVTSILSGVLPISGFWAAVMSTGLAGLTQSTVSATRLVDYAALLVMWTSWPYYNVKLSKVVKLRQGSGKERQGMVKGERL